MYVSMKNILQHADKHGYAVMAMNSINMEMARAGIEAAQEERAAIIINIGMGQMKKHAHLEDMAPMVRKMAKRVDVPVALNHDHGQDLAFICDCIRKGFSGLMIDASSYSLEENIRRTALVCDLAHAKGVGVEGELGHVGQAASMDDENLDLYTDVGQAEEFVERTGVDALAVAIGTAHGNYPKGKKPNMDFERLKLLKKALHMPLVLHGGSGSGEENLRKAVECGINKVNVCTDAFAVCKKAMEDVYRDNPGMDYMHLCMKAEERLKEYVKQYMRILGASGRY